MIAFIRTVSIAAMLLAGLTAVQAQAPAGPNRPATVGGDYLITPFGYFHPTCVVKLAVGDELQPGNKVIRHANGTTTKMQECGFPHYRADGQEVAGDERRAKDPNISHAWVEYASVRLLPLAPVVLDIANSITINKNVIFLA
jgi:hypothetical protein